MISLFQLWNLDDWDQRISFIFKGNFIGRKYLGFCFVFFLLISDNKLLYFQHQDGLRYYYKTAWLFFSPSEHHRVHIQLCDVHANFVNTFFCFVFSFHVKILVINIKYMQAYSIQPLTQESMSNVNTHKYTCKMWVHKFVSNQVTISH